MKTAFFHSSLIAAATFLLAGGANAMTIVENQKPLATIVIDAHADAQIRDAAKTLQQYVQQSSGAQLPIATSPGQRFNIHLGKSAFTTRLPLASQPLDREGFILQKVDADNYVVWGGSGQGVEYGVYEMLERFAGVRWLAETELFTDVPPHTTIRLGEETIKQEPVFLSRMFSPVIAEDDYSKPRYNSQPWSAYKMHHEWRQFNRLHQRVEFHHNLLNVFPVSQFGASHPEYYPLINGKRLLPQNDKDYLWQPNFSAPGIAVDAALQIEKYFAAHPQATSFSLGINDGRRWDESEASQARRKQLGGLSDEYATWVNAVVEKVNRKYPGKLYGFLAYVDLREPPKNIPYHPQAIPFITYELSRWSDPEAQEVIQELTTKWRGKASQIGWYDYFYDSFYLVPRAFAHPQADALRWLSKNNVKYYYAEVYPNFGEGPKDWVQSKLLWNPNQDVDALIDDWCTHAVGSQAAPGLKAYYALWEKFWTQVLPHSSWYNRQADYQAFNITSYLLDVPEEYVAESDRLWTDILKGAGTAPQKARAQKLHQMWQLYKSSIIARQGDEYWKYAELTSDAQALEYLHRCLNAIGHTQQRLQILSDMRNDPLYGFPAFRMTGMEDLRGADWGANSLWSLLPWVKRSSQVEAELQKLAAQTKQVNPPLRLLGTNQEAPIANQAAQIARHILDAANGQVQQLLQNPTFKDGWQGWQAKNMELVSQQGQHYLRTQTGAASLNQKIPYAAGNYYALIRMRCSQPAAAKVRMGLRAINQFGRQRGRNLPAGSFSVRTGEWQTFIVPFNLRELLGVTDTMSLSVSVELEDASDSDRIEIDTVQVNLLTNSAE